MEDSSDYGVKVTQQGVDAHSSGDSDLLFTSSWPTPKILFQGIIKTFIPNGVTTGIIKHGLGYVPMFIPYGSGYASATSDGKRIDLFRQIVSADTEYIYYSVPGQGGNPPPTTYLEIGIIIFDVDITSNFKAKNINVGKSSRTGIDRDFGIKLSKEGASTDSTRLDDYIFHSSTRSLLLHEVFTGPPNSARSGTPDPAFGDFVYSHDLPYNPLFLAYATGFDPGVYFLANNFSGLVTIGSEIRLENLSVTDDRASIIVFKDPFEIDNVTEVTI